MKNIRPFETFYPEISDSAWIDPSAVVIGNTHIGEGSSVWPNATIRGDLHKIRIGDNTNIQDNSILHISHEGKPYLRVQTMPTFNSEDQFIRHLSSFRFCVSGVLVLKSQRQ